MKIANSTIGMVSSYSFEEQYQRSEQLTVWAGDARSVSTENNTSTAASAELQDYQAYLVELSYRAKAQQKEDTQNVTSAKKADEIGELELSEKDKLKIQLVEKMVEMFTGKKLKIKIPQIKEYKNPEVQADLEELGKEIRNQSTQRQVSQKQGWGLSYDYHESKCVICCKRHHFHLSSCSDPHHIELMLQSH